MRRILLRSLLLLVQETVLDMHHKDKFDQCFWVKYFIVSCKIDISKNLRCSRTFSQRISRGNCQYREEGKVGKFAFGTKVLYLQRVLRCFIYFYGGWRKMYSRCDSLVSWRCPSWLYYLLQPSKERTLAHSHWKS